jgi:flagellar protein FliO/FliZ
MMRARRFGQSVFRAACAAIPALVAATAQAAQSAQNAAPQSAATASAGSFFQVLLGLVVVLGLLAAIAWLLKRVNLSRITGAAPVKIVGGVSVGARERVVVVEVAGQWIVVGVAPGQVNALSTMARPEHLPAAEQALAAPPAQPGDSFAAWLKQKLDKRNAQ